MESHAPDGICVRTRGKKRCGRLLARSGPATYGVIDDRFRRQEQLRTAERADDRAISFDIPTGRTNGRFQRRLSHKPGSVRRG